MQLAVVLIMGYIQTPLCKTNRIPIDLKWSTNHNNYYGVTSDMILLMYTLINPISNMIQP
jgi:hypothetical protein